MSLAATSWSPDAKFISCSGQWTQFQSDSVTYFIGFEKGAFYKWSCFIYSASKHQDTIIIWQSGKVTTNTAHITYTGAKSEHDPNKRNFYDPAKFISSQIAYQTAVAAGFNDKKNYQSLSFGMSGAQGLYGKTSVWELHEYSLNELDSSVTENPQGKWLKIYYIDGTSGMILQTISK